MALRADSERGRRCICGLSPAVSLLLLVAGTIGCGPSRAELQALNQQNEALGQQVVARLAKVHDAAERTAPSSLPTTCPTDRAAGSAVLIERGWLAWVGTGARWGETPSEHSRLNSQPLVGFSNRAVETNAETLQRRIAASRALLGAPVVVVLHVDQNEQARLEEKGRFSGGGVAGTLVVHDARTGEALCAGVVTSQPLFSVSVKQRRGGDQRLADELAVSQSVSLAFWRAAGETLSRMHASVALIE